MCIPCLDVESYYILPAAAGIACCPESATLQYLASTLPRNPCILLESIANVVSDGGSEGGPASVRPHSPPSDGSIAICTHRPASYASEPRIRPHIDYSYTVIGPGTPRLLITMGMSHMRAHSDTQHRKVQGFRKAACVLRGHWQ